MKLTTTLTMLISLIIFTNCTSNKTEVYSASKSQVKYEESIDSFGYSTFIDSFINIINCDDSEIDSELYSKSLIDSIKLFYEQLILRIDSVKHTEAKRDQLALKFRESILKSMHFYDSVSNADQSLLYYSFGDASARSYVAKCYKIFLLQQRLFFLKSIFSNSFGNFGFETIPRSK